MARPQRFSAQGETPAAINDLGACEIQTVFAHNPSEVSGAYVKFYSGAVAPTGASLPVFSVWVPPGAAGTGGAERTIPVFFGGALLWIAVATEAGAGLTAPASAFEISLTLQG